MPRLGSVPEISRRGTRILVQAPSWIGDLVMATAAFADLRRAHGDAHIAALVRPGRDRLLAGSGLFDELIIDRSREGARAFLGTAGELRRRRFDRALLFSDSLRAALLVFLAGIPARTGYRRNVRRPLLTRAVRYPGKGGAKRPEPMPLRYGRLLEAFGVASRTLRPALGVTAEEEAGARRRREDLGLSGGGPVIGFNPGASFGASKIWPPEHFARLGDLLVEHLGARIVLLVGPGEEEIAAAIERAMRRPVVSTASDPVPLGELKPFIRDLDLLVTTDSGPRHIAVAFDVPVVVVMGPTDPRYTDINLERTEVLRRGDVECIACHLKVCPIDHRCMRWISPADVLERIERLDRRFGIFGR